MSARACNENTVETSDNNEILTLIDLLVLRVECLANEGKVNVKRKKGNCPSVAEVDQNLIEYLYYLFTKFVNDESSAQPVPAIDKSNFVNVCQTLVRNGCFDIPPGNIPVSPDQSSSETASSSSSSSSDRTITPQPLLREYHADADVLMQAEKSSIDGENLSTTSAEQETWLVVDLEGAPSEDATVRALARCGNTSDYQHTQAAARSISGVRELSDRPVRANNSIIMSFFSLARARARKSNLESNHLRSLEHKIDAYNIDLCSFASSLSFIIIIIRRQFECKNNDEICVNYLRLFEHETINDNVPVMNTRTRTQISFLSFHFIEVSINIIAVR